MMTQFVRAIVFDGELRFRSDVPQRLPADHEVVVDVLVAGVCETDLQLCRGYMGFGGTLGHEFVGVPRTGRFAGQRVVGEINCACHQCDTCRQGESNHCPNRTVIGILNHDGAFADSVLIPERNLFAVPDHVPTDHAVFVEPLAAACRIPQQITLSPGDVAVVLGDGRLGNLCAQVLKHHGCRVTVIGKHDGKLRILRDLGIATMRIEEAAGIARVPLVVDCTGSPTGLEAALRIVRPCGTIVLKTTVAADQSIQLAPIVIDEIRVIGSRCGPFDGALKLLADESVEVAPLLSARYALSDGVAAFEHAARKDTLKVLLDIRDA